MLHIPILNIMRLLQINVDRRYAAHDLLSSTAAKVECDLIIVAETNKTITGRKAYYTDECMDAAIVRQNPKIRITEWGKGRGFVWVRVEDIYIYSCYISPKAKAEQLEDFLERLRSDMNARGGKILVGGDFNSKSPAWGSHEGDPKGGVLADWVASRNMIVLNNGDRPTIERGMSRSYIDVTLATETLARNIQAWEVLDEETMSLHNYISFEIGGIRKTSKNTNRTRLSLDKTGFESLVRESLSDGDNDLDTFLQKLKCLTKKATIRTKVDLNGNLIHWWNGEIARARQQAVYLRRRLMRMRRSGEKTPREIIAETEENYRHGKDQLRQMIRKAKKKC